MPAAPRIHVSQHAIDRYRERIGGSEAEARAALSGPAIEAAARFDARVVRLPQGRILLRLIEGGAIVVTVVPLDHLPAQLVAVSRGGAPAVSTDRFWPEKGEYDG